MKNNDLIRLEYLTKVENFLQENDEVLRVKSNTLSIPFVDNEGNEGYVNITFSIPKGTRKGEIYNGHEESVSYKTELEIKEEKRRIREKKKANNIKNDIKKREQKKEKEN